MDRTPNPDDQWFPDDWHHHSFPALPLANSHGFDIDFRWGSTWLDDQGVAAETASPDVPMTNWQSLQEKNSQLDAEIASTATNPHPAPHPPQPPHHHQHPPDQSNPGEQSHSNKRRSQRQRPAAIETSSTTQQDVPQPKKSGKATTTTTSSSTRADRRRSTHSQQQQQQQQRPGSAATSASTTPSASQHPYHRPTHSSRHHHHHHQSSRSSFSDATLPNTTASASTASTTTTPTFLHHQPPPPATQQQPDHGGGGGGGGGGSNSGGGRNTQPALPAHKIEVSLTSPSARVPHKAVEKKYREGIKAMFRRLGAAIPGVPNTPPYGTNTYADAADSDNNSSMPMPAFLQHEGVGGSEGVARPPQRPTKAGIISRAIEYIHRLEGEVAEERARREGAEAEAEGLRAEVVALRREVGLWRVGADMFEAYGEGAGEGLG